MSTNKAAERLRERWGSFRAVRENHYSGARRQIKVPQAIESEHGTVLFVARSFADPDDAADIVAVLNEVLASR